MPAPISTSSRTPSVFMNSTLSRQRTMPVTGGPAAGGSQRLAHFAGGDVGNQRQRRRLDIDAGQSFRHHIGDRRHQRAVEGAGKPAA
ncbi:MAG: hypothetical protein U1E35_09000 [Rhodospirillales bacterium]